MKPEIQSALKLLDLEPGNPDALALVAAATMNGDGGDPTVASALSESRRRHRDRGDVEVVLHLLDLELGWERDRTRRSVLLIEKGKLLLDELLREADAHAAFSEALAAHPGDEAASEALGQLELVRANWQKLLSKYASDAKASTDKVQAAGLHVSMAELVWKREPGSAAIEEHLRAALALDPKNRRARRHLERLLLQLARYAELAAIFEERDAAPGLGREEKIANLSSLAELQRVQMARPDLAAATLRRLLAVDASNMPVVKALAHSLNEEGDWLGLVKIYDNALKGRRVDGSETQHLLVELASVYWQRLGQEDQAEQTFAKVRKVEPANPIALDFYRAFHGERGEGVKLLAVLGQAQKAEPDAARRQALGLEMAQIAESQPGTVDKAIDIWKGILRAEPGHADAGKALKRLYSGAQKWNALLELLKEQVEQVALPLEPGPGRDEAVEKRVALLLEIIAIYRDHLNLDVMVINNYNSILSLRPGDAGALEALAQKFESMGRWNDLIQVLQRTVDGAGQDDDGIARKVLLLRRMASLWVEKLGNHNLAVKPLEELCALAPDDAEATARLREIYAKRRAWRPLLELDRKDLARLGPTLERRTKLIEMARLAAEKIGDPREAIGLWNQLLETDPSDDIALGALAALYDREKRYPALVEILRRQRKLLADPKAQVAMLEKIGGLCAEKLQSPSLAADSYREILRLAPNHPKAMRVMRELLVQAGDFAGLEQLYVEHGSFEELCETLLGVAERQTDLAIKQSLNVRVAEIALKRLKQPDRAAKAYERMLLADPANKIAAEALLALYRQGEKWQRALAMQEILIGHATTDDERFPLFRQVALLCEQKLGSKAQAFAWNAKAYAVSPDDLELETEIVRLAREADAQEQLAAIFTAELDKTPPGAPRVQRLRQVASLLADRLGRADDARKHYEAILAAVPGDREALDALERIHIHTGDYEQLLQIFRQRLAGLARPDERAQLLYKIAAIQEEQAGDLDSAAATYEEILGDDAKAASALRSLERIYSNRGQFVELADVVTRQLDSLRIGDGADDLEAEVALSYRLGEIRELHLKQPDLALTHYARAFARQPGHAPTLAALERFLTDGNPARMRVAELLAPVYEKEGEAEKQVGALRILLGAPRDGEHELSLLRSLTQLSGGIGDAEAAYGYAGRIFERLPGDEQVRGDLRTLVDVLDAHGDYAIKLAAAENRVSDFDRALARDLAWELGQLFEERIKRSEQAEQAYLRVLARDERHEGAVRALDRLYRAAGRYTELRALLIRRAELATTDAERRDLLFQVAELDEGVLADADAAASTYLQILDAEPNSSRATRALETIYTRGGSFIALDELYERITSGAVSPAERASLIVRRGELRLTRLDDAERACDLFDNALQEDPSSQAAKAGLEALLARPGLRHRAAQLLEPLLARDEDWPKLVAVLEAQREKAEGREAVDLLSRIARLADERMQDPVKALDALREAFRLDPSDEDVAQRLEAVALRLERHRDLAEAWEAGESQVDPNDLGLRRRLLLGAARIYDGVLVDAAKAKLVWQRLLDVDPQHLETARPAAEALARLHEGEDAWADLVGLLRLQAVWAEAEVVDGNDKKHFLRRAAVVEEDLLGDRAAAIATHREILGIDPADRQSLDALERLHSAAEHWTDLIDILRRRVELSTDGSDRRELFLRIAGIFEQRLTSAEGPWDDAIAAYMAILDEEPDDVAALDALARLHRLAGRPSDLLETLERRLRITMAAASPDPASVEARQELRAQLAALHEGPLAQPQQALERYREILAQDSGSAIARAGLERMLDDENLRLIAAEILEPLYAAQGETDRMIHLSELWAEHASDVTDRIAHYRKVSVLKERNGEHKAAFDALARAARLAVAEPELPSLLAEIEAIAAMPGREPEGGLVADLVALYRELGPDAMDEDVQERISLTVAAKSHEMGDRATARDYYRRVLDTKMDHLGALSALEGLYREGGEFEALLEIVSRRSELAGDDSDLRRHYLLEAARLCEAELARPSEAIVCYEQILEMFPADGASAASLELLLRAAGRFAEHADLLERRLGFADDLDEAVALRVRLGEIYEKELSDRARAVENYRAALGGDANHAAAIASLERFLDDAEHRVEAAEVLEPVYAGRHDWKSLIHLYEIRLEAVDEPARRLQLTRRIARLYEDQLEDLDGAFVWYGKVFRESPDDRSLREQLSRLANILGAHARLAEVYEEYLQETFDETPASIEALRLLAAIYDGRLANAEKAKVCYLRLLAYDPNDGEAFQLLESSLTRAERWQDLLRVYRDAADHSSDPDRRKALLLKICQLQRHELHDADGAIIAYREVLDLDPADTTATLVLDELYTQAERWQDLVDFLAGQLERVDALAWKRLKLRIGRLQQGQLGDVNAAVDAFEDVLRSDRDNVEARTALEHLVMERDVRLRIAEILEPIYREQDQWAQLVVIYDAQLEFLEDKQRRVELLCEIARLHEERGGSSQLAFSALGRAWSEEIAEGPDREEPLYASLVQLAEKLRAWPQLIGILTQVAGSTYDEALRALVYGRIALIQELRLGDVAGATESWRAVTQIHEADDSAWQALERLLEQQERSAELVEVLEKRAQLTGDLEAQKAFAERVAELQERVLGAPEQAIATWRNVLALDEEDPRALSALERLYRDRGAVRELAWVYARRIDLSSSDKDRRRLWLALAEVQEEAGELAESISAYRAVLVENPADPAALKALVRLHEAEEQWPELIDVLDTAAHFSDTNEEREGLRLRAAQVLESKEGDAHSAVDRYRQILEENPGHAPSRTALERLLTDVDSREAAARVLEPLYRQRGEYAPLVDLLEARCAAEGDSITRRELLGSIAALQEAGLHDSEAAFETWSRVLAEEPTDGLAYLQLERIAVHRGSWRALAALYQKHLSAVYEPETQRFLSLKLATLSEEQLGDRPGALDHYRKVLELSGDEPAALAAVDRLLSEQMAAGGVDVRRASSELADVLEREAGAVNDPTPQAELWYRLGELQRTRLSDEEGAIRAYREALDRVPAHAGARAALEGYLEAGSHLSLVLDLLEPLYEADSDHPRRIWAAEVRLAHTSERTERVSLLSRIASIAEHELLDDTRALDATARALGEMPDDLTLADEIEQIAVRSGKLTQAAGLLERLLERGAPTEAAREIGLRAARLYARAGDETRARDRYQAVLDSDPESVEALGALERIYRAHHDASNLADVLARRSNQELDPTDRKAQLSEVAQLRQGPLGDEAGAVEAWQQVLAIDEADLAALTALATLHEAAGRYQELAAILEQHARYDGDPRAQAATKARVAEIYAMHLSDLERAIDAWRDVLELEPQSILALRSLEELHTRRGDFLAVQEVLSQQLGAVSAAPEQIAIFRRLAAIALAQNGADDAIGYFQSILDIAHDDEEALFEIEQLLEAGERWYDLVDSLKRHAEVAMSLAQRDREVALLVRAANVLLERLDDGAAATDILETILAREPRNLRALGSLAQIHESGNDLQRAKETLERAAALGGWGPDAALIQFKMGRIEEQLYGDGAGEHHFTQALTLDPDHLPSLTALEGLARERGKWPRVAEFLRRRLELVPPLSRRPLWLELAAVQAEKLRKLDDAIVSIETARQLDPGDLTILEPLAEVYFAAGRSSEALPIYQSLIEATLAANKGRRTKDLARLYFRIGSISEQGGDMAAAMEGYGAAHAIDAAHAPSLAAMGRLALMARDWERARRVFRALLLQNLDPQSGIRKAQVYLALGEIHEQVSEAAKAIGMYERGLELEPQNPDLKAALARAKSAR